jgi:hypothetical protein
MRVTALFALLMALPPLFAEDPKPAPATETPEELAARQEEVGKRLKQIEETMGRIRDILAQTDPEKAARLDLALRKSRNEDRNLDRIREIQDFLNSNDFQNAIRSQRDLSKALERLLDLLLDKDAERKAAAEQEKRLEEARQMLETVLREEKSHFQETERFADPEKTLQRAAAAKAKLADLIRREQGIVDGVGRPAAPASLKERLAELEKAQKEARGRNDPEAQAALAAKAEALAKEMLEKAAQPMARAAAGMAAAAANMKAVKPFDAEQEGAEQDLREAREALERLENRSSEESGGHLADEQERVRADAERLAKDLERLSQASPGTPSGSAELGKAQEEMRGAEKSLRKRDEDGARARAEAAKAELEKAMKRLEELEKTLQQKVEQPDYEKLAKNQEGTTDKTGELQKKLQEQNRGGAPTPGQGAVEGAKKAMQSASRNLRQKSARGANSDQKEAIDRLEKAKEELEEALRQLREELQLMLLDTLERRFQKMLQDQDRIFRETVGLNLRLKASKEPAKADAGKSRELAEGELALGGEADKVLEIVREEGSTVVIPDVLADLKADFDTTGARLRKLDAGEYTQRIQQDILETLRQLLRVIEEERNRRRGGGGGGEGSPQEGDQEDRLLPTSAELKMLRELQVRVNRRTEEFDRMVEKEEGERTRIAEKQKGVASLTRTMADKLNRQDGE